MDNAQKQNPITDKVVEEVLKEVERHCTVLDLTNADRIALWLQANTEQPNVQWLAVQIAEAFERTISRKHISWGPGDPDCPPEIKTQRGELHTLRCKVCGQDISRAGEICFGSVSHG